MLPERQFVDEASWYSQEQARERVHLEVYTNNRNKTKKRHLRKLSQKQKLVLGLALVFSLSLVYVSLEAKITQVGYSVNQLQADIAEAQEANDRLMVEVEQLTSPERIAQYASENDGMVVADAQNIIYADIQVGEQSKEDSKEAESGSDRNDSQNGNLKSSDQKEEVAVADNGVIGAFSSWMDKLANARAKAAAAAE